MLVNELKLLWQQVCILTIAYLTHLSKAELLFFCHNNFPDIFQSMRWSFVSGDRDIIHHGVFVGKSSMLIQFTAIGIFFHYSHMKVHKNYRILLALLTNLLVSLLHSTLCLIQLEIAQRLQ